MEKKIWTKPEVGAVQFAANEYVTACSSVVGAFSHDHGLSTSDSYFLLIDSKNNDSFDFDPNYYYTASDAYTGTSTFAISPDDPGGDSAKYSTEDYFNHMTGYSSDYSDQVIRWEPQGGTQIFPGCSDSSVSEPETGWFTGWFSTTAGELIGKARIWWDNAIHASFASVSHSG